MRKLTLYILFYLLTLPIAVGAKTTARAALGRPDMEMIAKASVDETSKFYYPRLYNMFMKNDTVMTAEEYQYFYYGTLFQEDYDPYRESPNPALLQELQSVYAKEKRTRADLEKMSAYAEQVLKDNPIDLRQLTNKIYVYEQKRSYNLAKIWQNKLNHLLLVIAASGTGLDTENAFIVVYPQHEYDFLNISKFTASSQRFEPPYYDYISITSDKSNAPEGYYFNISELLHQYFLKHPGELKQ